MYMTLEQGSVEDSGDDRWPGRVLEINVFQTQKHSMPQSRVPICQFSMR